MIQKVVKKARLRELNEVKENLAYWMSRSPSERVAAVDELREREHGSAVRLQRIARVVQRERR